MRFVWLALPLLSSCSPSEPAICGETFCLPSGAKLTSKQEIADFNLYQIEWHGNRFGIYEGNFPAIDASKGEPLPIPLDVEAKLVRQANTGNVLAQVSDRWPKFVHVSGPCPLLANCPVSDTALALTPRQ